MSVNEIINLTIQTIAAESSVQLYYLLHYLLLFIVLFIEYGSNF